MPATLQTKLRSLEMLPPYAPGNAELAAKWNALHDYFFHVAPAWYREGVELPPAARAEAAALWSRRPDLRSYLDGLILWYPCAEFKRGFFRTAKSGSGGDFAQWFALFPDLKATLHPYLLARSRRFNKAFTAIDACLLLARHYDAGDDAYRQIANAIHRDDRREAKRGERDTFVRHDLETHGTLTRSEAEEVNRFLAELQADLLRHWR